MCVSVSPGVTVRFSNTVLYAAEVIGGDGDLIHVLGYQNEVRGSERPLSSVTRWLPWGQTGNAMILPFPALPGSMTNTNVLDTKAYKHALQDMAAAVTGPRTVAVGTEMLWSDSPKVQVFHAGGIYTVVLAQDARDIPAALGRVPRSKRPTLNPELFNAYARWYPNWTVALCCFNNREAQLADPLLWWYKPMHPDRLFLPALDCHTGEVPSLGAQVLVDHVIAVGSHRMNGGRRVYYRNEVPSVVAPYLRPKVIGRQYHGEHLPNGDFVCLLEDVAEGVFNPERCKPPAA